jgi:hypothetical protein
MQMCQFHGTEFEFITVKFSTFFVKIWIDFLKSSKTVLSNEGYKHVDFIVNYKKPEIKHQREKLSRKATTS